jgi:putative ABC transport system permease protein
MLRNYILIALRNMVRNRLYASLNITGLAVGIAACLLILLYVQDELSFDRFHDRAQDIYRMNMRIDVPDRSMDFATVAHVQGPQILSEFPEVENCVRLTHYRTGRIIDFEERSFEEDGFLYADPSFFDVFSFQLLSGDPATALKEPNSVVITKEIANKYFGDGDPMGKSLRINREDLYQVTGVMANVPQNSHFHPDFIGSFTTLDLEPSGNLGEDMLSNVDYPTYVLMRHGTQQADFEQKLVSYVDKHLGEILKLLKADSKLYLTPLTQIYLRSHQDGLLDRVSDISYVYLFAGIGLFILLLACLNFMNLSTARSANRAKEVGLRKTVGAQRPQLIRQFIGESMILTLAALILAVAVVALSLPLFQSISGKTLSFQNLLLTPVLAGILMLFLLISFFGGSYPALFLSAYRPADVLQGRARRGTKGAVIRILLVSFQFTVSIVLIIGTLVVSRQLNYMRHKKLGYDKEHVVTMRVRNPETRKSLEAFKRELLGHPGVLNVSASQSLPLGHNSYSAYHAEGKSEFDLSMLYSQVVDDDFVDTYRMQIIDGRNFSREFTSDADGSILINEAAVRKLGWQDSPLGKKLGVIMGLDKRKHYEIVGVVKDYHFRSLHEEISPLVLFRANPYGGEFGQLSVRLRPENITATMAHLESTWGEFESRYPYEYSFLNDRYDTLYRTEERLGKLFGTFTALAILIGSLGLFGLTSFVAEQRTKEIGIRKVLGASVSGIMVLLIKDFTKWVLVAVLIAWPVGYLLMHNWLQNFAYRGGLSAGTFVLAAGLALVIAVLTVAYQTMKASLANPVDSLHYE